MSGKMTKSDMVETIELYFKNKGQKLTNLRKATIVVLEGIIRKYNINMEDAYKSMLDMRIEKVKLFEAEEKKREEIYAKSNLEYKERMIELLRMYNDLTTDQREDFLKNIVEKINSETIANNAQSKSKTDRMYNVFKSEGARVERISDNELKVNGVTVVNNCNIFYNEMLTYEEFIIEFNRRPEYYLRQNKSELEEMWGREYVVVWKKTSKNEKEILEEYYSDNE